MDKDIENYMHAHGWTGKPWKHKTQDEKNEVRAEAAKLALKSETDDDRDFWRFIRQQLK